MPREDLPHLAWVRRQACIACLRRPPSQAHHLLKTGDRGMGMKSSDRFAVPLCQSCHAAMHHFGGESTWFAMNGVPAYEWAELNGDKRDDEEAETPEV